MDPAMNIGVFALGKLRHRREHAPRLLRRGCVVEIGERPAIDLTRKDLELRPHRGDIEHTRRFRIQLKVHAPTSSAEGSLCSTKFLTASRMSSRPIPAIASSKNARTSNSRASACGMPRERK